MAKKFTLEKVLYFTQKDEAKGFHVGPRDAKGSGTDLSGIITHAKGNDFIFEKSKDGFGTHYGITDKGRVRLLFAKMIFNMQRDYPMDDLAKDVMAKIPAVLENEGLTYAEFSQSVTDALKRKFDGSENKKMNKLFNQFGITAPTKSRSPIKKLRVEFEEFGKIIASYGPEMKPSIGDKAKSLFKRFVKGDESSSRESLSFEDENTPEKTSDVAMPKAESPVTSTKTKGSSSSSEVKSPAAPRDEKEIKKPAQAQAKQEPLDETRVMKTLNAMFEHDPVYDDFHDEKLNLPDGVPIKSLVDTGLAKLMDKDDVASYYQITPQGSDFALRVKKQMLSSAGLSTENVKPMLPPKIAKAPQSVSISLNGKQVEAPVNFDHSKSHGEYVEQGDRLMRELMPKDAANTVNDLHWDAAYDENLPLYDAVKDIVDNANFFTERVKKNGSVQPEQLKETALTFSPTSLRA
jgi:predicted transcriptional regulator